MYRYILLMLPFTWQLIAAQNNEEVIESLKLNNSATLTQLVGDLKAKNSYLQKIDIDGHATLDGCTIFNSSTVSQTLRANSSKFYQDILVNDDAFLNGTTIEGLLQTKGNLIANNASLQEIDIDGHATLNHCKVIAGGSVSGLLVANSSTFYGPLSSASHRLVFDNCILMSLHILKPEDPQIVQIVELKGGTKIHGGIIFEAGNGQVIADEGAEIIGAIIGGNKY